MTSALVDPAWPAPLALLLGPDASGLVQAALAPAGGRLVGLRATAAAVRPSGATVVQYAADVDVGGRAVRERIAATTGARIPDGAAVLEGGGVIVGIWRFPLDPALPGLARAADPAALRRLLTTAGLPRTADPDVRLRTYRPGRRAVLAVTGGGPPLYCKVVRPNRAGALSARHDALAGAVPVPPVLAATDDGVLVLPALRGTPLRALLAGGGPLPDGPALDALLDGLPAAIAGSPHHAGPHHLRRAEHFAAILSRTVLTGPDDRADLDALVAALAVAEPEPGPPVAVHGDFHEAQVLAVAGRVTGLLDVDAAGPGHRIDEWATLLAHLSVLGTAPARRWGTALLAHAERRHPRARLRPRIAAAVLGLATGPFRVQQPGWGPATRHRVALAHRWLAGATE